MRGEALYKGGLTRSPAGWATAPPGACRLGRLVGRLRGGRQGGDRPPLFFLQGLRCKFKEKNLHLSPVAPHRATGVYF